MGIIMTLEEAYNNFNLNSIIQGDTNYHFDKKKYLFKDFYEANKNVKGKIGYNSSGFMFTCVGTGLYFEINEDEKVIYEKHRKD